MSSSACFDVGENSEFKMNFVFYYTIWELTWDAVCIACMSRWTVRILGFNAILTVLESPDIPGVRSSLQCYVQSSSGYYSVISAKNLCNGGLNMWLSEIKKLIIN